MLKKILVGLLLGGIALPGLAGEPMPQPRPGDVPPPLLGKLHGSDTLVDLREYRGKVVIVTFWASWCGPCRKELPVLAHFQKTVGNDALEVIAVNFKEPRSDFISVVRANRKLALNYVHDSKGVASDEYGVNSLPNMFVIDRDGTIAYAHRGYSEAMLPGLINEIVGLLPEEVRTRPAGGKTADEAL
jgi:thiol-disulfide isomerase/thioredoxin